MYHPTLEEVEALASQGNLVPVYREINADLETPVSAYIKIARPPYSFLLESVEGGERIARYSFIGTEPYRVITTGQGQPDGEVDPLTLVQEEMDQYKLVPIANLPRFHGGAVGYFDFSGNMDTAIAIRTAVIKDNTLHIQAGAGVVADSIPRLEWKETMNKGRAIFRAVAMTYNDYDH